MVAIARNQEEWWEGWGVAARKGGGYCILTISELEQAAIFTEEVED